MADALVSIVLEQLSSIVVREVEQKVRLVTGVEKEVAKLEDNLKTIQAVVRDAENRQFKEEAVKQWIHKLKSICYDVDNILDEWSYAILKSQLNRGNEVDQAESATGQLIKMKKEVRSLFRSACCPCYSFREIGLRQDIAEKIQEINGRMNDVSGEIEKFNFVLGKDSEHIDRFFTTSVVDITEVKGRDGEKNAIVNTLLRDSNENPNPKIVALVGMAGIGKTTLAKLVYNDGEIEAHFEERIWVCVSDPFDEIRIAKAILESLMKATPNLTELQSVLQKIQQYIKGKKFLLVLDDVWEEDPRKWEQLKHTLTCGSPGSKILVTTRKEIVANMMEYYEIHHLRLLPMDECWLIFSQVAFFRRSSGECKRLEDIGKKMVDKCKGLPLAAKTLGGLLRDKKSREEWQSVLDSELWEYEEAETGLFAPLLLSYNDLPPTLRQCFSYCAIFPKDYVICSRNLIELWMAQGYLKEKNGQSMSRVGEEYFQYLAARSFFQDFEKSRTNDSIISCKIHDVVHDFAKVLAKNECFSVEISDREELQMDSFSKEVRHSMVLCAGSALVPNSLYQMEKLHSLLIESNRGKRLGLDATLLSNLFKQMTCLRSLNLSRCDVREIPFAINKLVHLRQLDLSRNDYLRELPETVCELYNLQILDVSRCFQLKLPDGIGKLINLSHLHNSGCFPAMPKGIGRLSCLKTLDAFVVGDDGKSCSLGDLKTLNSLQGRLCAEGGLCMAGLEKVNNVEDAKQAQLHKKTQLTSLMLSFGHKKAEWRKSHDEELIEALEPPPNLGSLFIQCFQGTRVFPTWMMQLSKLRKLTLYLFINSEQLPPLGKLPSLEILTLWSMYGVKKVGVEFLGIESSEDEISSSSSSSVVAFPKLTKLVFGRMDNWEDWIIDDDLLLKDSVSIMPCLNTLELCECPKLKGLPSSLLQKIMPEKLVIWRCSVLYEDYQKGGHDWHNISHIIEWKHQWF